MKNLLIVFLTLAVALSAPADDNTGLSPTSTADDASTVLDHQVGLIINKYADNGYDSSQEWVYRANEVNITADQFNTVSTKVLLELLNQQRPYDKGGDIDAKTTLKRQALFRALMHSATTADLPDLLASPAVEALWVVSAHPAWINDPAVASFLTTQLGTLPSNEADDQTPDWISYGYIPSSTSIMMQNRMWMPSQTWEWTVLNLAVQNNNAAVQKGLVDTIQRALTSTDARALFFANALEVVSRSKNPDVVALASPIMARLVTLGKFPYYRANQSVSRLITSYPDLLKDAAFDSSAISFIKDCPYGLEYEDSIVLACLGDTMSFSDTMAMYFDKDTFPNMGGSPSTQQSMQRQFNSSVEAQLLRPLVYHGPGDRMQGIKAHYHEAVFQGGHWVVTDPSDTTDTPAVVNASSPAPTPHPTASAPVQPPQPVAATMNQVAPATNSPSTPVLPNRISIISRAPMETLDGSGQVASVAMAVIGAAYEVVRADGTFLIVKDASGTQYRIVGTATQAAPEVATPAPISNPSTF